MLFAVYSSTLTSCVVSYNSDETANLSSLETTNISTTKISSYSNDNNFIESINVDEIIIEGKCVQDVLNPYEITDKNQRQQIIDKLVEIETDGTATTEKIMPAGWMYSAEIYDKDHNLLISIVPSPASEDSYRLQIGISCNSSEISYTIYDISKEQYDTIINMLKNSEEN